MAISPGFWADFRMIFASNCAGIIGSYRVITKKIRALLHYSFTSCSGHLYIQRCWTNPPQRFDEFPAMLPVARWRGWSVAAEHRSAGRVMVTVTGGQMGSGCDDTWGQPPGTPALQAWLQIQWVVRHASIHVPSPSTWDLGVSDVLL